MHRLLGILLAAILVFSFAAAEALPEAAGTMLPETAVFQSVQQAGKLRLSTYLIPESGEEVVLSCDEDGGLLSVQTQKPAKFSESAAKVDRARAEELVQQAYPGSHILFTRDDASGKLLGVSGDDFCGTIVVSAEGVCSRDLEMGEIFRNGILTMESALKILALHRPEADFYALELEEDDGSWEYEGEALVDGEEYEFELNACTGKLLEWERDS